MLTVEQFKERASVIYGGQRDRHKKKLLKALPKGVTIEIAGEDVLPYTRQEFYAWLWQRVGLQVVQCPYCSQPIDILSLVIDHKMPLKLGGSVHLDNQEAICATCNGAKGKLLPDQFTRLLAFLRTLGPTAENDVLSRLKMGSGYLRTMFINKKQGKASQRAPRLKQQALGLDEF